MINLIFMKKRLLIIGMALMTGFSFAQQREIRRAERALNSQKYSEVLSNLKDAEGSIASADKELQAKFYALRGEALTATAGSNYEKAKEAANAFIKAFELNPALKNAHQDALFNLRTIFINSAVSDQNANRYTAAAEKLITSYKISEDPSDLYFAASNYVNAQEYSKALEYYQKVLDLGYTGQTTEYVATHKETGEVHPFDNENLRNIAVRTGEYIKPEVRVTESRRGEILRNMTLIYIQQGENEKAIELMKAARAENPNDVYLMRAEADMSYNMGDMKRYNELMSKIIETDPDNPELYFNLGVGTAELGENEKAEKYYEKALELKPDYESALINLAVLKLSKEGPIVEEMNSLGTSRADNQRYEELKKIREDLYRETLPYLEKAYNLNQNNIQILRTLMNIYSQLGEDAKFQEMKAKVDAMESGN